MGGQTTFEKLSAEGKAKFDGDHKAFDQLRSTMTTFVPDFELMPGTKSKTPPAKSNKDPFEAPPIANSDGA
jgi:hypothetical protein